MDHEEGRKDQPKYALGEVRIRRSASPPRGFSGHYLLSLFLMRLPRPQDFLGTEMRAPWSTEPSESEDLVNGGRRVAAAVSLDYREFMTVGSGLKESSKNDLLPSSSGSTPTANFVAGPRGTIFKGGEAGFLCFLGALRLWFLWHLTSPDAELPLMANRVTHPGLRG
jgi:hypothetical protein